MKTSFITSKLKVKNNNKQIFGKTMKARLKGLHGVNSIHPTMIMCNFIGKC